MFPNEKSAEELEGMERWPLLVRFKPLLAAVGLLGLGTGGAEVDRENANGGRCDDDVGVPPPVAAPLPELVRWCPFLLPFIIAPLLLPFPLLLDDTTIKGGGGVAHMLNTHKCNGRQPCRLSRSLHASGWIRIRVSIHLQASMYSSSSMMRRVLFLLLSLPLVILDSRAALL